MSTKRVLLGFTAALAFLSSMVLVGCESNPTDLKTYTITFNANGGNVFPANGVTGYDGRLAELPSPAKTGYAFDGWLTSDNKEVNTSTVFKSNATIYAKWIEPYFIDSRDGQTYGIAVINGKKWMAQNLNYAGSGGNNVGVCYNNLSDNCSAYGRLYTWAEAMDVGSQYSSTWWNGSDKNRQGICPAGWHLPSDEEWTALTDFIGSNNAGTRLKSKTGWNTDVFYIFAGTDDYGFSALPGGYRWGGGSFFNSGDYGFWWSATEGIATDARCRYIHYNYSYVFSHSDSKSHAFSVRCLKD